MTTTPHHHDHLAPTHKARLETLKRRFMAANMRSRSLRLTRPTRSGALDLHRLQDAAPKAFEALLKTLGHKTDATTSLVSVTALDTSQARAELRRDLSSLARAARADWMQTGIENLAVGWPFLEGRSADGTWLRGPLLLYPAKLDKGGRGLQQWQLTLNGPPSLNLGLTMALWRLTRTRITIDDLLEHDDDKILAADTPTFNSLHAALKALKLPLLNDSPTPSNNLTPWPVATLKTRQNTPTGRFALQHHIALGRFPRAGSSIALDYEQLLENTARPGLATALLAVDEDAEWQESTPLEDHANTPTADDGGRRWQVLSSDSSQDAIFNFLAQPDAQGLVVQGPPGTGKSQMIANLVAAAVGQGQRVLLVCQKRAALDVVAERLQSVGVREPIAVVHDVERDRNTVCEAIVRSLEPALATANPEADALTKDIERAERDYTLARSQLDARVAVGQRAWDTLATTRQLGHPPLAELQQRALHDDGRPLPDLRDTANCDEGTALGAIPNAAALTIDAAPLASPHPLAERGDWAEHSQDDLDLTFQNLQRLRDLVAHLHKQRPHAHLTPSQARDADPWHVAEELLDLIEDEEQQDKLDDFLLFWFWTGGQTRSGQWSQVMNTLRDARRQLTWTPHELVTTPRAELAELDAQLTRLAQLRTRWVRFLIPEFWRLRPVPGLILRRCPSLTGQPGLVKVEALVKNALAWHDFITQLPSDNPVLRLGFQGDPAEIDDEIDALSKQHNRSLSLHKLHAATADLKGPYSDMPELDPATDTARLPFFAAALADRAQARTLTLIEQALEALHGDCSEPWLMATLDDARTGHTQSALDRIDAFLKHQQDAPEAARLDTLCKPLPDWVRAFLRQWRPHADHTTMADPAADAALALERAWRSLALGQHSPHSLEAPLVNRDALQRLGDALDRCQRDAGRGVVASYQRRLIAQAQQREHARAMRKLAAEARKKRRRLTLRQLVEQYWDSALAYARPAWFCSPESVAALFPLREALFDLVIFDEASQCPVESALSTFTRARRVIVAGDDQQMPPSHFFRASDPDEDDSDHEDSAILSSHSLLALARVAFPDTTLRWHYRSRHETLVAFSNAAFYGGRLITAPQSAPVLAPDVEGMHWHPVDGLWREQRNEAEAQRVVALITTLLQAHDPPSIGVVTFNRKQAELVETSLEEAATTEPLRALMAQDAKRPPIEQLFIRNLENVQGDERDVIIFSVGYGPSEPGGRVHARFGPLGQAGGEKRLNVAITRARLGIHVVASFDPHKLKVDHTTHPGPKLLARYLRFVHAQQQRDDAKSQRLLQEAAELGGGQGITGAHRDGPRRSRLGKPIADALYDALTQSGLHTQRGLGLGSQRLDIAVKHPEQPGWALGIDCTEFLAMHDPMARDVYTPRFWARLGWRVLRVSPAMWLHRRDQTIQTILDLIEAAPGDAQTPS